MLLLVFFQILILSTVRVARSLNCQKVTEPSGILSSPSTSCWNISVTANNYVKLELRELRVSYGDCPSELFLIRVAATNEEFKYCPKDGNWKPIIALSDVSIIFNRHFSYYRDTPTASFKLYYNTDNIVCARENHFRCPNRSCIHRHQVCDGVTDCKGGADEKGCENVICSRENHFRCSRGFCIHQFQVCDGVKNCNSGADEEGCETSIESIKGVDVSRKNLIIWLRKQQSSSYGWVRNTHRAITALYLTGNVTFNGDNIEGELVAKQLELQTSVSLLRNFSEPLTVSELSMFINALTVTCHNPRQFYGYDLLQILSDRAAESSLPYPGAHLTLCLSNWAFPENHTRNLLKVLQEHSEYPFYLDVQAMTIMALSCVKNKTEDFEKIQNATNIFNETINQFIEGQKKDGSFGNVYTTALVTQALLSSGQENNKLWNVNSTINFLMHELNSSTDFLSTYLTLPIFKGKSLFDIGNVNCTKHRKHGEDDEISDVTAKLSGKMRIQYSLYVGDQKDVIHTMYLRMPENSTAYDIMRIAQVTDPKYKFLHSDVFGHMYVYEIGGITNDPETGKFWLLYCSDYHKNEAAKHHTKSPDKFIVRDGEHLIMWYKTAHL